MSRGGYWLVYNLEVKPQSPDKAHHDDGDK
jgi:hypothetical protein